MDSSQHPVQTKILPQPHRWLLGEPQRGGGREDPLSRVWLFETLGNVHQVSVQGPGPCVRGHQMVKLCAVRVAAAPLGRVRKDPIGEA